MARGRLPFPVHLLRTMPTGVRRGSVRVARRPAGRPPIRAEDHPGPRVRVERTETDMKVGIVITAAAIVATGAALLARRLLHS